VAELACHTTSWSAANSDKVFRRAAGFGMMRRSGSNRG
jgi:hypothetical protein